MAKIKHGFSRASIGHNIGEMVKAGKGKKQAVAAALNIAREAAAKAGKPGKAPAGPKKQGKKK